MAENHNNHVDASVICIAYNHGPYIKKALDSILAQETDYSFEILINDDCSTDGTTEIIKEYAMAYPNIRPFFHDENQYSKGIRATPNLIKEAKGDYIFFCECDDYFCNNRKIQIQIDEIKRHADCVACIHGAIIVSNDNEETIGFRRPIHRTEIMDLNDIINSIGGNLYALNSLMCYRDKINNLDDLYFDCAIGDIPIALHLALQGHLLFIDQDMSCYRANAIGSWSSRMKHNVGAAIHNYDTFIDALIKVRSRCDDMYHDAIDNRLKEFRFFRAVAAGDIAEYKKSVYEDYRQRLPIKTKFGLYLRALNVYDKLFFLKK